MKKIITSLLIITTVVGLTACQESNDPIEESANDYHEFTLENIEFISVDGEFPETTLTFNEVPERVFVANQGPADIMVALGLEDKIVASNRIEVDFVEEYNPNNVTKEDLNHRELDYTQEELLALDLDLILSWRAFMWSNVRGTFQEWQDQDVNTYMVQGSYKVSNIFVEVQDILNIGKIFDVEDEAMELANEVYMDYYTTLAGIDSDDKDTDQNVFVSDFCPACGGDGRYRHYGSGTLVGDLVTSAGSNIMGTSISGNTAASVAEQNPDVIFIAYGLEDTMMTPDEVLDYVKNDPVLQNVEAVKNNRVYAINYYDIYTPTVRFNSTLSSLLDGLYPSDSN